MVVLSIVNYDYYLNDYGPVLRLICRDESNKRHFVDLQDDMLTPKFYIRQIDKKYFEDVINAYNIKHFVMSIEEIDIKSSLDEDLVEVKTKFPWQVGVIRNKFNDLLTFQADIKWEKMVIQELQFRQFIEVNDDLYNKWGITPIEAVKSTDKFFKLVQNICFWDIETDGSALTVGWADYRNADKIPIVSYVSYNRYKNEYTYYAWKDMWEDQILEEEWETELMGNVVVDSHVSLKNVYSDRIISNYRTNIIMTRDIEKTIKSLPKDVEIISTKNIIETLRFENYPRKSKLILKLFNKEVDMHKQFIDDFMNMQFDGILTFNGRGGNKNLGKQRKWFNGFDMPMFYNRCKYLGLENYINRMSPFPTQQYMKPVKERMNFDDKGMQTKYEIYIKGVAQHDFYYDAPALQYTKFEYKMQRQNLDTYMLHFLGIGKVQHKGSVADLFNKNWRREMYYNIVDVEGMFGLEVYFDYINDVSNRSLLYAGKIEDALYASKVHDHINLWYAHNKYIMDTKIYDKYVRDILRPDTWKGMLKNKVGGYNFNVGKPSIYGMGFIVDFSKLYPSCYITSNIDIRTKVNVDYLHRDKNNKFWIVDRSGKKYPFESLSRTPSGFFRRDIQAQNSIIFKELIDERNVFASESDKYLDLYSKENNPKKKKDYYNLYKAYDAQQFSYKTLINGKFGAEGNEGTRTFDKCVYNASPSMGQDLIKFVIKWLKNHGYELLLASTDSALVEAKDKSSPQAAWDEAQKIVKRINIDIKNYIYWKFNPYDYWVKLGVEKVFDRVVIFDVRRYIMHTIMVDGKDGPIKLKVPKTFYKGLELVRKDSAMVTKDVQIDIIDVIMNGSFDDVIKYVQKIDKEFNNYPWSYICSRAGISNDISLGSDSSVQYNACRIANKLFDKGYNAGVRPLLGYFDKHPTTINGKRIPSGELTMAFDEHDQYKLTKLGFGLNMLKIKKANLIKKITPFLNLYDDKLTYEVVLKGGNRKRSGLKKR